MPDLRGDEQGVLRDLLVSHLDQGQLERALVDSDLPPLEELAAAGTLPDMAQDVVRGVSRRYRTETLVRGALDELDGECPPLADWLAEYGPILRKRRSLPRRYVVSPVVALLERPWRLVALAAALALVAWVILRDPEPEPEVTELTVHAREMRFDADGRLAGTQPLASAELTVEPANFDPAQLEPGVTDASGKAVLRVAPQHQARDQDLLAFLHVRRAPPDLESRMPLMPSVFGVWYVDGQRLTAPEKLNMTRTREVHVDVLAYEDYAAYMRPFVTAEVERAMRDRDAPAEELDRTAVEEAARRLNLGGRLEAVVVNDWFVRVLKERPLLRADQDLSWRDRRLQDWTAHAAASVCYVKTVGSSPRAPYAATGFVVGHELVLTLDVPDIEAVGFGSEAGGSGDRLLRVRDVLWRDQVRHLALLDVPGLRAETLALVANVPGSEDVGSAIAVVGYPSALVPPTILAYLERSGGTGRKRVMPGEILWVAPRDGGGEVTLGHDATTAAGVSCGPVLNSGGGVVAVHAGGRWVGDRKENFATLAAILLEDPDFAAIHRSRGGLVSRQIRVVREPIANVTRRGFSDEFLSVPVRLPRIRDRARIGGMLGNRELTYPHFSVVIDEARGMAAFAAANVDRAALKSILRRGRDPWLLDPRVPEALQRGASFYARNDWDRGHLVRPTAVAWGSEAEAAEAYRSAFTYTNATPQHARFNRGPWMRLEEFVLRTLEPEAKRLCLFVGPAFHAEDVEYRGARVPRRYWMIAVLERSGAPGPLPVHAYLMTQYDLDDAGGIVPIGDAGPFDPKAFEVPVGTIERMTGLDFGALGEEAGR